MKGGVILGKGAYGIIYYNPRFLFKEKHYFNNDSRINTEISKINNNTNNNINKNEVSKIFKNDNFYENELKEYKYLLIKYSNIFNRNKFNLPLYYGKIFFNDNIIYKYSLTKYSKGYNTITKDNQIKLLKDKSQIVFKKGDSISNNNILDFFNKFKNIIEGIKLLIDNNLFYDDLKFDNLLEVKKVFLISDFSSIIEYKNIKNFKKIIYFHYYIYYPIYLQLIYSIITENKYSNIYNKSFEYIKYMIKNVKLIINNYQLNEIDIDMNVIKIIVNTDKKVNKIKTKIIQTKININNILDNILILFDNNYYTINSISQIFEYNNQSINLLFKNNDDKIKYLLDKQMLYSIGIIIIQYISNLKINNLYKNELEKLLKIFILCCTNIYNYNNILYLNNSKIDDILNIYDNNKKETMKCSCVK